jgi:uridine phosphorylase
VNRPGGEGEEDAATDWAAAWPILRNKDHSEPSVFRPEALLREARRQKDVPLRPVPRICILDPDGDVVRHLKRSGKGSLHEGWACYHTELLTFRLEDVGEVGIVGCAVGASFAVLVAEQLFASGCRLLVSVTSAGRIADRGPTPYFVLIDRALRDEGTSYHYLPPSDFSEAPDAQLVANAERAFARLEDVVVHRGATWTTDAPYRETAAAIDAARGMDILAVEMEAAALYAFAAAEGRSVFCLAHVTNAMAQAERDFEKGEADGVSASLAVIGAASRAWLASAASNRGPGEP